MTAQQAKQEGYNFLAEIYGFRCYFRDVDNSIVGTNWFNTQMICFFVWLDVTFDFNDSFAIKLIDRL